jgi:hypothetical protein
MRQSIETQVQTINSTKKTTWLGLVMAVIALVTSPEYLDLFPAEVTQYIALGSAILAALGPQINRSARSQTRADDGSKHNPPTTTSGR